MPTVLNFQRLKDTLLPEWTKPENVSVFDPAYRAPIRKIISLLGLDDPQQVMALGTPLEAGSRAGGAVEAISKRFPRFAQALKVYHGSPHDFERFDASKIGTGEGAQAYGHGLYFAEDPKVAEFYKQKLGPPAWQDKGPGSARDWINHYGSREKALDAAKQQYADELKHFANEPPERIAEVHKIYGEILQDLNTPPSRMYEVAIHADPEHFLDWDKPLSQQTSSAFMDLVRSGLKRAKYLGPNDNGPRQLATAMKAWQMEHGGMAETTIESLLGGRGGLLGSTPEEVSKNLSDAGIPGLKYFDQGSRVKGRGSRNYVVFPGNEHLIDILKKYGIAATTGVGIAGGLNANE